VCREGIVDHVIKLALLYTVQGRESHGKHTTKGRGKSLTTSWDVLYERCLLRR